MRKESVGVRLLRLPRKTHESLVATLRSTDDEAASASSVGRGRHEKIWSSVSNGSVSSVGGDFEDVDMASAASCVYVCVCGGEVCVCERERRGGSSKMR